MGKQRRRYPMRGGNQKGEGRRHRRGKVVLGNRKDFWISHPGIRRKGVYGIISQQGGGGEAEWEDKEIACSEEGGKGGRIEHGSSDRETGGSCSSGEERVTWTIVAPLGGDEEGLE